MVTAVNDGKPWDEGFDTSLLAGRESDSFFFGRLRVRDGQLELDSLASGMERQTGGLSESDTRATDSTEVIFVESSSEFDPDAICTNRSEFCRASRTRCPQLKL